MLQLVLGEERGVLVLDAALGTLISGASAVAALVPEELGVVGEALATAGTLVSSQLRHKAPGRHPGGRAGSRRWPFWGVGLLLHGFVFCSP